MGENFLTATDVATICGVSKSKAYHIIADLNTKMQERGFYTISGKINRRFFETHVLYAGGNVSDKQNQ